MASNGVGQDKMVKSFVTVQCKSTSHHDTVILAAKPTLSDVAPKELLLCVTVRTTAQSYVKSLLCSEMRLDFYRT